MRYRATMLAGNHEHARKIIALTYRVEGAPRDLDTVEQRETAAKAAAQMGWTMRRLMNLEAVA
jgi:hypothetical protein